MEEFNNALKLNSENANKKTKATMKSTDKILDSVERLLSEAVLQGITDAKNTLGHGNARFRLDQLLESSQDLILEFAKLGQKTRNIEEEGVTVQVM